MKFMQIFIFLIQNWYEFYFALCLRELFKNQLKGGVLNCLSYHIEIFMILSDSYKITNYPFNIKESSNSLRVMIIIQFPLFYH